MVEKKIIGCLSVSLSTLLPYTLALPLPFTAGCASTCLGKSQSQILKLKKVQFVCLWLAQPLPGPLSSHPSLPHKQGMWWWVCSWEMQETSLSSGQVTSADGCVIATPHPPLHCTQILVVCSPYAFPLLERLPANLTTIPTFGSGDFVTENSIWSCKAAHFPKKLPTNSWAFLLQPDTVWSEFQPGTKIWQLPILTNTSQCPVLIIKD